MSDTAADWLTESGWFQFDSKARDMIGGYSNGRTPFVETEDPDFVANYTELSAAEICLASEMAHILRASYGSAHPTVPFQVSSLDAALTLLKVNCGSFTEHPRPKPRRRLRIWDLFAFAGDMSKVELFLHEKPSFEDLASGGILELIRILEAQYREAGPLGRLLVDANILRVQGLIWNAKAAILLGLSSQVARTLREVGMLGEIHDAHFSAAVDLRIQRDEAADAGASGEASDPYSFPRRPETGEEA